MENTMSRVSEILESFEQVEGYARPYIRHGLRTYGKAVLTPYPYAKILHRGGLADHYHGRYQLHKEIASTYNSNKRHPKYIKHTNLANRYKQKYHELLK